jgi:hypothetical protein
MEFPRLCLRRSPWSRSPSVAGARSGRAATTPRIRSTTANCGRGSAPRPLRSSRDIETSRRLLYPNLSIYLQPVYLSICIESKYLSENRELPTTRISFHQSPPGPFSSLPPSRLGFRPPQSESVAVACVAVVAPSPSLPPSPLPPLLPLLMQPSSSLPSPASSPAEPAVIRARPPPPPFTIRLTPPPSQSLSQLSQIGQICCDYVLI